MLSASYGGLLDVFLQAVCIKNGAELSILILHTNLLRVLCTTYRLPHESE